MLIVWIVVAALWMVVHVFIIVAAIRAAALAPKLRWAVIFPPAAPLVPWYAGARPAAAAWCVLGATYLVLRMIGL